MFKYIMGCLFSKSSSHGANKNADAGGSGDTKKEYSWDSRPKLDPKDFMFDGLKGETMGKLPGTVSGQQFIIQNCHDCDIYILDHTSTVTVDDCVNCRIFLGPIKNSVFMRDCKDCKLMVACQQFRTRDCHKIHVFLSCVTQPIIEATTAIKFGCFQFHYPQLRDQFKAAGLSIFNNNWSNIHDFTPVTGETNFSLMTKEYNVEDYIPLPTTESLSSVQITTDRKLSTVPQTLGKKPKPSDQSCLVVIFSDGDLHSRAKYFIEQLIHNHPECVLVQSKELKLQSTDAQRVFGTDSYDNIVAQGPLIGLEFNGNGVIEFCQHVVNGLMKESSSLVFISSNHQEAKAQIDNFYNYADMQMNV